jgi:hypothetical protein
MLQMRPGCECCDRDLSPDSGDARICSFECTFCRACVETVLHGVCPNCGGGFVPRPVRPSRNWKGGNYLGKYPASAQEKHRPVDRPAHESFAEKLRGISPVKR